MQGERNLSIENTSHGESRLVRKTIILLGFPAPKKGNDTPREDMEALEKFLSRHHECHGARFVWRHFLPCCDGARLPHPQTLADLGVAAIEERRRQLIERDYCQRPVNSYDYRWRFVDDPDHVYVLETNVRMNKWYSGKVALASRGRARWKTREPLRQIRPRYRRTRLRRLEG